VTFLHFLIAWGNAPFTVAGAVAILFALLSMTGVMGLLAGGDHDGHEADHDVDADADADGDADCDHEQYHDNEHEDYGGDRGFTNIVLGGIGVGRIPLSLIWQTFALVFAVTGLILNASSLPLGPSTLSLVWNVPIASIAAYGFVALLARILGPIFATKEAEATKRSALVGQIGTVISSRVTSDFGEIRLKDHTGHIVRVLCKLADGSRIPNEHEQVVVVDYEESTLFVTPLDAELPADSKKIRVKKDRSDDPPDPPEEEDSKALDKRRAAP
jgi:membrane protein implicated in regulation of membrane protease activity